MATTDASQVLAGIKQLIANPPRDKTTRDGLYQSLKELSSVIEDPYDTIFRISTSPMNLTFAVVANNLNIFEILAKKAVPSTVSELAKTTSSDEVLLGRILRYLASQDMIKEVREDTFAANNITQTLSVAGFQAGLRHNFDIQLPCLEKTPQFLSDTSYANPSDVLHSAFQIAHQTDQPAFVWALGHPKLLADNNLWMTSLHDKQSTWLDAYDFSRHYEGAGAETVVFVDVAGGIGQQCALLKQKLPDLKGRVILQDLQPTIDHAMPNPGVENTVIDMWEGQHVKGARAYYMRNVLHDYPDQKCILLLQKTVEAMSSESVIIIDEIIIPNKGAHARSVQLDITMMISLASMERTEKQWDTLLAAAGLSVLEKKTYNGSTGESVIVTVPKA